MLHAVIPAGGSGTRLWPLSRSGHPKFLHPLTGTSETLLQATVSRLAPLSAPSDTIVVTGVAHAAAVARQLPGLPEANILVEPSPRDSCAAIGLAAAVIQRRSPGAIMGAFAADHVVQDNDRFIEVLRAAIAGAQRGQLMTIGITPTHPETGYGYLHRGALARADRSAVSIPSGQVLEFKEKPSREIAAEYVASGQYLWNAGMFVWKVDVFLSSLQAQEPELHAALMEIAAAWDTPAREEVLGEIWPTCKKISVDYAVMEGAAAAGLVGVVPGDFGWNDVGDFQTLGDILPGDEDGNVVVGEAKSEVLLQDTRDCVIVPQQGRLIAALGMRDVIIVDTPDALMICPRDRAQDVKKLVDELKSRGDTRL